MRKQKEIKVTVIVPVYQVKEYIEECIDSLINQTLEQIEIILIDDCSTDGSAEICDKYARLDERITVIHNRERQGAASSRNKGIEIASGEYIGFVDADDYVDYDMYKKLYSEIPLTKADVVCCEYMTEYKNTSIDSANVDTKKVFTQEEAIKKIHTYNGVYAYLWNKIFKREIINSLYYENEVVIGEDYKLLLNALRKSDKIVCIPDSLYYYRKRKSSVCNRGFNDKFKHVYENYTELEKDISKNYPNAKMEIESYCMTEKMIILQAMAKGKVYNKNIAEKISKDARNKWSRYMHQSTIPLIHKVSLLCIVINPRIFVGIMKVYVALQEKKYQYFD